ncbi:MAG TPA: hypothetical protein VHG72_12455 [Polyangia bacterium]|nr:hypothetical protein [Polyangia bacterium]
MPLGSPALLLLALLAQAGAPAPVPVRVDFDAPAGCADGEVFLRGVLARTSHVRRAHPGESATRLTVHLARSAGRVHGELRMSPTGGGPPETRRVDGASCAEVVQVLSLTAALAIDPMAGPPMAGPPMAGSPPPPEVPAAPPPAAVPSPPPPSSPLARPASPPAAPTGNPPASPTVELPPPPPPPIAPPPPETVVTPRRPESPVTGATISVAAIGSQVLASSLSLGATVSGRYVVQTRGGLTPSLALAFRYLAGDFFHGGDDLGSSYTALAATVCPGWAMRRALVVEPCARVTAGLVGATDHSVTNPRSVDRWWESAGVLLHGALRLGSGLTLDLEAGVDVPFVTRHFVTTTPAQAVGATASVSPSAALGLSHPL